MTAADWKDQGPVSLLLSSGEVVTVDYRSGVSLLSRGVASPAPVERRKRRRRKSAGAGMVSPTVSAPAPNVVARESATLPGVGEMSTEKEPSSEVAAPPDDYGIL